MSSHDEWVEQVTAEHDRQKPYAPENGNALQFQPGDPVIYTNDAGASFRMKVARHFERPATPSGLYALGARYFLEGGCDWFPVRESSLRAAPVGH